MHKTLKAETTRPPKANRRSQQRRFSSFIKEFNEERPHESLGQEIPADFYERSARAFPKKLPEIEYPSHFEVRLVSTNTGIRWKHHWVCLSRVLAGQYVGLEEIDDGLWTIYFGPVEIGRLDERGMTIEDTLGYKNRRKV